MQVEKEMVDRAFDLFAEAEATIFLEEGPNSPVLEAWATLADADRNVCNSAVHAEEDALQFFEDVHAVSMRVKSCARPHTSSCGGSRPASVQRRAGSAT